MPLDLQRRFLMQDGSGMKLLVFSDLHLEHRPNWSLPESFPDYDVCVAAGDIDGSPAASVRRLASNPGLRGKPIVFTPGNHKYYRNVLEDAIEEGQPQRLATILASLSSRRTEKAEALSTRIIALQREVTDADEKLKRLYRLVEDGMTDLDEVLKDRLNTLKSERDRANAALDRARPNAGSPIQIDPTLIEQFGRTMRENFSTGSAPFRKAYLQSLIDVIEVDDAQIRIKGSKDVLERAVLAGGTGSLGGSQMSTRWRAGRDSNP